jgi:hypothetical protein
MAAETVYVGFVIGNLVLITAFPFPVSAFSVSALSLQPSTFSRISAFSFLNFSFSVWPAPAAQGHGSSDGAAHRQSTTHVVGCGRFSNTALVVDE